MTTKICPICLEEKDLKKFRLNPDGSIRGNDCHSCRGKRERAQLKLAFLKEFDSKCSCCGEIDPRFLTLDHINNDGNLHRKELKEHQIMRKARKEGWPRDKYTCLCFNCNCARSYNNGICPHKCITILEYLTVLQEWDYKMGKEYVNHNTSNLPQARESLKQQRIVMDELRKFSRQDLDKLLLHLEEAAR